MMTSQSDTLPSRDPVLGADWRRSRRGRGAAASEIDAALMAGSGHRAMRWRRRHFVNGDLWVIVPAGETREVICLIRYLR